MDATTIRKAVNDLMTRQTNAIESFLSFVQEQTGCTTTEAEKVLRIYRKERIVKIDSVGGQWTVKHGAFLDAEVLRNAINA